MVEEQPWRTRHTLGSILGLGSQQPQSDHGRPHQRWRSAAAGGPDLPEHIPLASHWPASRWGFRGQDLTRRQVAEAHEMWFQILILVTLGS